MLDMGMFHGLTVEQAAEKVNEQYPLADVDGRYARVPGLPPRQERADCVGIHSGVLSKDEFIRYVRLMEMVKELKRRNSGPLAPSSPPAAISPFGTFDVPPHCVKSSNMQH